MYDMMFVWNVLYECTIKNKTGKKDTNSISHFFFFYSKLIGFWWDIPSILDRASAQPTICHMDLYYKLNITIEKEEWTTTILHSSFAIKRMPMYSNLIHGSGETKGGQQYRLEYERRKVIRNNIIFKIDASKRDVWWFSSV